MKLIKNRICAIRGALSIILAPSEERRCQASSSLPPLTVFLFVAEPERCISISKFVFPRKLSRVTFTEKRKRYFYGKNKSITPRRALFVSLLTYWGFPFSKKREKIQRTTDFLMQTYQPFPVKASQAASESVTNILQILDR